MKAIHKLRNQNIQVDFYPDASKIDKQFKHAERRQIPFVVKEIKENKLVLKNLVSGLQEEVSFGDLVTRLKN
jgi:histidyl-tRNA synthetase